MGKAAAGGGAELTPSRRRKSLSSRAAEDGDEPAANGSPAAAKSTPRKRAKTASAGKSPKKAAAAAAAEADGGAADAPPAADADAAAAAAPPRAAAKPKTTRKTASDEPTGPVYDTSMRAPTLEGPAHRFISWNVAGMRALMKKDAESLRRLVEAEQLDAVCLQETKLQESHVADVVQQVGLQDWHVTFNCSTGKKGYSGTATLCRQKPLSVKCGIGSVEHDDEGRVVTVELPEVWLVNVYTPNSGEGLKRLDYRVQQWDKALASFIKGLRSNGKPVVVLGDLNCAHQEIDVYAPKKFKRAAGFTQEERDSFGAEILGGAGLVDAWRTQHPGIVGYTYYSFRGPNGGMRAQGKGWRLDYTLVSEDLAPRVHDAYILKEITGSDHVPLGIVIKKS